MTEKQREKARVMKAQGLKYREIADYFRVHPDTIRYQIKPWYVKVADRTELTPFEKGVWVSATKADREANAENPKAFVRKVIDQRRRAAMRAMVMRASPCGGGGDVPR